MKTDHYASWWIYAESGVNYGNWLSIEKLDECWDNESSMVAFNIRTTEVQMRVYFGFNTTKYSKPSEAYYDDGLSCLYGIGFDQINTSTNAWNLIGSLLFFQMPDVHPAINALIAIPLWALIAYLIYVLILKAIPLVESFKYSLLSIS